MRLLARSLHPVLAKRDTLVLLLLGLSFVVVSAWTARLPNGKFSSPDETANAFFTRQFVETGRLAIPYVSHYGDVLPRSVVVTETHLLPGTFLGLPILYGTVGKLFGVAAIPFFAGALSLAGVIAFYAFLRSTFSASVARLSLLLLLVQPVFWYYASRPYWHNGQFVSLLMLTAWLVTRAVERPTGIRYALAGFAFGVALAFRTVEALWLVPLALALTLVLRRKIVWRYTPFAIAGLLLPAGVIAYEQFVTYQSAAFGAYGAGQAAVVSRDGSSVVAKAVAFLVPWGVNPVSALQHFWQFSIGMMFPATGLGLLGAFTAMRRWRSFEGRHRWYALFFVAVAAWLALYYGSLTFVEYTFDPGANLLGSSFLRYWLPLYVFALPLAVMFILKLGQWFTRWRRVFLVTTFSAIAVASASIVLVDPNYGIVVTQTKLASEYRKKYTAVLAEVPADGIIIAGPDDKVYWPDRRVIGYDYGPMPDRVIRDLSRLAGQPHVYLTTGLSSDVAQVNARLEDVHTSFVRLKTITGSYALYQLVKAGQNNL